MCRARGAHQDTSTGERLLDALYRWSSGDVVGLLGLFDVDDEVRAPRPA